MSGVNDELEAAQAELGELVLLGSLREAELVDALAERDAEAALADRLAEALQDEMDETHADHGWRMGPNTRGALAAHRERRTPKEAS